MKVVGKGICNLDYMWGTIFVWYGSLLLFNQNHFYIWEVVSLCVGMCGDKCVFDPIIVHLTVMKNKGAEQYFALARRPKKDTELNLKNPPRPFSRALPLHLIFPLSCGTEYFRLWELL